MKNYILTIELLLSILSSGLAQTEKGRWQVGVGVGNFTYQEQQGSKYFSGNLTPTAGYFVADNLLIGTGLPLSLSQQRFTSYNTTKYTGTSAGLSPFVRYYIGKSSFKPYAGVSYSYAFTHNKYDLSSVFGTSLSGSGYSTSFIPTIGVAYFINRTVALNAGLAYTASNSKSGYISLANNVPTIVDSKSESKYASLDIGFQIFFGK